MNRFTPLIVTAIGCLLLALAGCDAGEARTAIARTVDAIPTDDVALQPRGYSIYALDTESWWDQAGAQQPLESLAGRVQVVAMVYTHCHHTCPQIVADLMRIENETEGLADKVGFVLVSLDPARDDSAQLDRFARGLGLDPARWTLLRGTEDGTRALAAMLGVRYREAPDQEIAHTNEITVLDAGGDIVHQRASLGEDLGPTIRAVRAAAEH